MTDSNIESNSNSNRNIEGNGESDTDASGGDRQVSDDSDTGASDTDRSATGCKYVISDRSDAERAAYIAEQRRDRVTSRVESRLEADRPMIHIDVGTLRSLLTAGVTPTQVLDMYGTQQCGFKNVEWAVIRGVKADTITASLVKARRRLPSDDAGETP